MKFEVIEVQKNKQERRGQKQSQRQGEKQGWEQEKQEQGKNNQGFWRRIVKWENYKGNILFVEQITNSIDILDYLKLFKYSDLHTIFISPLL